MFATLTDRFCTPTMCTGSRTTTTPRCGTTTNNSTPIKALSDAFRRATMDDEGKEDAYANGSRFSKQDDDAKIAYSPTRSIQRIESFVAPSTPVRDCYSSERRDPPSPPRSQQEVQLRWCSAETPKQGVCPVHVRKWEPQRRPMSPWQVLKRATPLDTKDEECFEKADDDTLSTQAISCYNSSLSSILSDSEDEVQHEGSQSSIAVELDWRNAIVEDTAEGFRIHAPPSLVRLHTDDELVFEPEEDFVYETPQVPPRCTTAASLSVDSDRAQIIRSPLPFLPELTINNDA